MTPIEKGERAKQLLDDPVVTAVFNDLRAAIVDQIEAAPPSDIDSQHELALQLRLLKEVKLRLARYASEIAIDKHKIASERWIDRMRERLA